MSKVLRPKLLVVGGGPGGYVAAIRAGQLGVETVLVEVGRLGVAESVIARLRDVGGNARLFSTPGAGTTVILEVPR